MSDANWQFRQWHRKQVKQKELDMNRAIVEGSWMQFKGKVEAQWGKLTDEPARG
jgi:hypothetical protein